MVKQSIRQQQLTETGERRTGNIIDYTFDDVGLPTADEMAKYKQVNPDIIRAIIEIAQKEQAHRHETDFRKLEIIQASDHRIFKMNLWGMVLSLVIVAAMLSLLIVAMAYESTWLSAVSVTALFLYLSGMIANYIGNKKGKGMTDGTVMKRE